MVSMIVGMLKGRNGKVIVISSWVDWSLTLTIWWCPIWLTCLWQKKSCLLSTQKARRKLIVLIVLINENQYLVSLHHIIVPRHFMSDRIVSDFTCSAIHPTQSNTFVSYYLRQSRNLPALQNLSHFSEKQHLKQKLGVDRICQTFWVRSHWFSLFYILYLSTASNEIWLLAYHFQFMLACWFYYLLTILLQKKEQ